MIATVRHHDVTLPGEAETLRPVQRTPGGVHVGEEGPELVKHLDPRVPPVRHQDVVLAVHCNPGGCVELTISLACEQLSLTRSEFYQYYHWSRS